MVEMGTAEGRIRNCNKHAFVRGTCGTILAQSAVTSRFASIAVIADNPSTVRETSTPRKMRNNCRNPGTVSQTPEFQSFIPQEFLRANAQKPLPADAAIAPTQPKPPVAVIADNLHPPRDTGMELRTTTHRDKRNNRRNPYPSPFFAFLRFLRQSCIFHGPRGPITVIADNPHRTPRYQFRLHPCACSLETPWLSGDCLPSPGSIRTSMLAAFTAREPRRVAF